MLSRRVVGLHGLAGIPGLALQVTAARDRLRKATESVARELEALLADAVSGDQRARLAALPCCIALAQDDGAEPLERLALHAARARLPITRTILRSEPSHRAMSRHGRLTDWHESMALLGRAPVLAYHDEVDGWQAARPSPTQVIRLLRTRIPAIDKLLLEPDPERVKRLLTWEGLRPAEVIRIAARRPTTEAIVRVLCADLRWIAQRDVREALVLNPFVPTGIAMKLLPMVSTPRRLLSRAPVHPLLHEAADALNGGA